MVPLSLTTGNFRYPEYLENRIPFFRFDQALDLLVSVSFMRHRTSTSDLSTLSSSRGLTSMKEWEILS